MGTKDHKALLSYFSQVLARRQRQPIFASLVRDMRKWLALSMLVVSSAFGQIKDCTNGCTFVTDAFPPLPALQPDSCRLYSNVAPLTSPVVAVPGGMACLFTQSFAEGTSVSAFAVGLAGGIESGPSNIVSFISARGPPAPTNTRVSQDSGSGGGVSIILAESFTGSNVDPLGGHWSAWIGNDPMQRFGNLAIGENATGFYSALYNTALPPDDQYAKVVWAGAMAGAFDGGPAVRVQTGVSASGYQANFSVGNGIVLRRVDLGTSTDITSAVAWSSPNVGDVLEIHAIGSAISVWLNGSMLSSATDTTYTSGTFGMRVFGNAFGFSSFEGGVFASSAFFGRPYYDMIGQAH